SDLQSFPSTPLPPTANPNITPQATFPKPTLSNPSGFNAPNPSANSPAPNNPLPPTPPTPNPNTGLAPAVLSQSDVSALIFQARQGGVIQLKAGIYRLEQGLELNNDIKLLGAGKNRTLIVAPAGGFTLRFSGRGSFAAEGITFVYEGLDAANVLHLQSSYVSLRDVRAVTASFRQNPNRSGSGLLLDLYVQNATISQSEFDFNPQYGIVLRGQVKAALDYNLIHHNGLSGIYWGEQAGGSLRYNLIEDNAVHGLDITGMNELLIEQNQFNRNGWYGIMTTSSAKLNLQLNQFNGNGQGEMRYY
ncbi:MAG: right-handed parallel beta-helix repeat-containing protein, partial [Deinococcales bacterium]